MAIVVNHMTEFIASAMQSIKVFFRRALKRRRFVVFLCLLAVGSVVGISVAHAQGTEPSGFTNGILKAVSSIMLKLAEVCIKMSLFFLKFFLELARYNGYLDAPPVIIGWVMVRDVANMFFVVVLLAIAIGTILGIEQYEWKKTLVKLILAAVFINFSKLIAQLLIDIAHVFTMTFLNAITATAGGNLINMFGFDKMVSILSQAPENAGVSNIRLDIVAGSILALIFAAFAMATIGAYLFVMALRVVVLWTLIILAPLAYLLGAIPNTQSYAKEYWDTFIRHVMVAPVMVFFLWLSFATLGNGNIASQINLKLGGDTLGGAIGQTTAAATAANPSTSILEITTWENMANFMIAIAFLLIGISVVQKLGVKGGDMVSGAVSFAKNVALLASGYAAGRWIAGKGVEGTKFAAKGGVKLAYMGLGENAVERVKMWGQRQVEGYRDWRAQGPRMVKKVEMKDAEMKAKDAAHVSAEEKALGAAGVDEQGYLVGADGNRILKKKMAKSKDQLTEDEIKSGARGIDQEGYLTDERGQRMTEQEELVSYSMEKEDSRGAIQKLLHKRHEKLIRSKKVLDKVTKQKDIREQLMDKRVTAVPEYLMQRFEGVREPRGGKVPGEYYNFDALDRIEQGQMEGEKARSGAKTEEFQAIGKKAVFENDRFKDGEWQGKGTIAEMVSAHKVEATKYQEQIKELESKTKRKYTEKGKGARTLRARLQAQLEVRRAESESKRVEGIAMTDVGTKSKKGMEAIQKAIAAERAAHTEAKKLEAFEKEKEGEYLRTHEGQHELTEEAELAAKLETIQDEIKALDATAKQKFDKTEESVYLDVRSEAAKAAIVAAEQQIKRSATTARARIVLGDQFSDEEFDKIFADVEPKERERIKEDLRSLIESGHGKVQEKYEFDKDIKILEGSIKGIEEAGINGAMTAELARTNKQFLRAAQLERAAKGRRSKEALQILQDEEVEKKKAQVATILESKQKELQPLYEQRQDIIKRMAEATNENDKKVLNDQLFVMDASIRQAELQMREKTIKEAKPIIDQIEKAELRATEADKKFLTPAQIEENESDLRTAQAIRDSQPAWQYAIATARATKARRGYSVAHNTLLSAGEQEAIWGIKGAQITSTALTETNEEYERKLAPLPYEQFVSDFKGMIAKAMKVRNNAKKPEGERNTNLPTPEDFFDHDMISSYMGYFLHGVKKSWIDDILISISKDQDSQAEVQKRMPWWNDPKFTDKKNNLVQSAIASGFDWDFVEQHDMVGDLYNVAGTHGFKEADVIEAMQLGRFEKNGRDITQEILNDPTLKDREDKIRKELLGQKERVEGYLDVIRNNQGAFQTLDELREKVTGTTHPENGGHAKTVDLKNGEKLKMPTGWRIARDSVLGEEKKVKLPNRVNHQTHAVSAILTESAPGMVMLALDPEKDDAIRNGVTGPNEIKDTTPRFYKHFAGLESDDKPEEFQDDEGRLIILSPNRVSGQKPAWLTHAEKTDESQINPEFNFKELFEKEDAAVASDKDSIKAFKEKYKLANDEIALRALQEKRRLGLAAALYAQHIMAVKYRNGAPDMTMLLGKSSNVQPIEAQMKGKMRIAIPNREGDYVNIDSADQFVELYNNGAFQIDYTQYKKPVPRVLAPYSDAQRAADKKAAEAGNAGKGKGGGGGSSSGDAGGGKPKDGGGKPMGGGNESARTAPSPVSDTWREFVDLDETRGGQGAATKEDGTEDLEKEIESALQQDLDNPPDDDDQ